MKKTDILIISSGKAGLIYRCLLSIANHIDKQSIGVVALSWNGSDDELENVQRQAKDLQLNLKVIKEPYQFSGNNNRLVKEFCRQEYLLFLNDDIELKDNFVEDASSLLENPQVGFVGSKLVRPDNKIQHAGVIAFVNSCGGLVGPAHYMYEYDNTNIQDWTPLAVTGACMMCRRELFNSLGGFNEEYDEGFQDFDICVRAVIENKTNVCLNSCSQLHEESATRDKKVLQHDSDILAAFWRSSIPKLMKSQSPSCVGIVERKVEVKQ